jgi:hypothetical protein
MTRGGESLFHVAERGLPARSLNVRIASIGSAAATCGGLAAAPPRDRGQGWPPQAAALFAGSMHREMM